MYNINKSLSMYVEMHREVNVAPVEDVIPEKKVYPKVDIHEAMNEIEMSMTKITDFVKKDLDAIAALDIKMKSN